MGLLLIWILYDLAQGWGCPYPVMLGWGTPAEPGQVGEALSACWVQCCVCIHRWPAAQLCPAQQLAPTGDTCFSNGLWLDSSRCVTGIRSALSEPGLLRAQGPGQTCRGWWMATCCSNTSPVATAHTRCPVCSTHTTLLSSPRSVCSGCFQVCCSLLPVCIHLPSPFAWKRRDKRGMSHTSSTVPPWQQPAAVTAC